MVSRGVAWWLIVLILAPFTAPFPTCDLAALFGCSSSEVTCAGGGHAGPRPEASVRDARTARGSLRLSRRLRHDEPDLPLPPAELTKDLVVLTAPTFLTTRSRLAPLLRIVPFSHRLPSSSLSGPLRAPVPIRDIRRDATQDTVLRV